MMRARFLLLATLALVTASVRGDELPRVTNVDPQPLIAQAKRVAEALDLLGQPLSQRDMDRLSSAAEDPKAAAKVVQDVLDPLCLVGVEINPESRVKAAPGPAAPKLVQQGWKIFLVKVQNDGGVTAPLRVMSPNAEPVFKTSTNAAEPKQTIPKSAIPDRWMDVRMFDDRPLNRSLSGLGLEYRVIQVYSRDAGKREGKLKFDVGQGTQDLGFRAEADLLFNCEPGVVVTLDVSDEDGSPTVASFLIRNQWRNVFPAQSKRLAPDFYFHPQVYRKSGETVILPPGVYDVEVTRGPEYLVEKRKISVPNAPTHRESFRLKRWANLAKMNWFSGDHHVHAAGCGHYESPTEGVTPDDMMRHILGEDLDVGCVLAWGPCWYAQKAYFDGKLHPLSTDKHLMRYDIEVSGFPSSHTGHLCLIRLKEDDYPNTTRIEEWPSWDLPVLQWGKKQGGVVGFSHSGWGLATKDMSLPTKEIPPFDGIGANEYIVDVVHDAVDFISTVDTPASWELSIWYHTLNCGFRTRISGETDFPCIYGERVGLGRSYVNLPDGKLDFDKWAEGIKQGRSYVTDGKSHLADFVVGGVKVGENGSELKLDKPGKATVKANVAARLDEEITSEAKALKTRPLYEKPYWDIERARIGSTRTVPVELVVNGKAVARKEIVADGTFREIEFQAEIAKSSWVALRIYPSAHTNPVFVTVEGKPVRASKESAEWCLKGVEQCWKKKEPQIRKEERAAARAAYDVAVNAYKSILGESSGD